MKEMWDQRYSSPEYIYGREPNNRYRMLIDSLPAGRILLPGEGEGRNAVYAARRGWEVTALDQSAEGRCKALALAEEAGVVIRYEVGDLLTMPLPSGTFDLISLIFVHFPPEARLEVHKRLSNLLSPRGVFHLLAFRPEQLALGTGGPKNLDLLYSEKELRQDFAELGQVNLSLLDDHFDEGSYHRGPYAAIEMIARW
jgi:SAM-dependent methyltransferase